MKHFPTLKRMTVALLAGIGLTAAVPVPVTDIPAMPVTEAVSPPTVEQVLAMDARAFSDVLGHRLSLKERLAFQIGRKGLREELRKNSLRGESPVDVRQLMADGEKGFRFGGFVLGLLLGLIGVLIAYLMKRDKGFIRSAWIGWGVWVGLVIVFLAASGGTA